MKQTEVRKYIGKKLGDIEIIKRQNNTDVKYGSRYYLVKYKGVTKLMRVDSIIACYERYKKQNPKISIKQALKDCLQADNDSKLGALLIISMVDLYNKYDELKQKYGDKYFLKFNNFVSNYINDERLYKCNI